MRYNLHRVNFTHFRYTILWVLKNMYSCTATITMKIKRTSVTAKCSLMPLWLGAYKNSVCLENGMTKLTFYFNFWNSVFELIFNTLHISVFERVYRENLFSPREIATFSRLCVCVCVCVHTNDSMLSAPFCTPFKK